MPKVIVFCDPFVSVRNRFEIMLRIPFSTFSVHIRGVYPHFIESDIILDLPSIGEYHKRGFNMDTL